MHVFILKCPKCKKLYAYGSEGVVVICCKPTKKEAKAKGMTQLSAELSSGCETIGEFDIPDEMLIQMWKDGQSQLTCPHCLKSDTKPEYIPKAVVEITITCRHCDYKGRIQEFQGV